MNLQEHLTQQQLLPSTKAQYKSILTRAEGKDPIAWLKGRIHARTPIGTVLPYRAAVKHYLMAEQGYTEDELRELLPKAKGPCLSTIITGNSHPFMKRRKKSFDT